MAQHKKEITTDTIIREVSSFLDFLRDHASDNEDWAECETCRKIAEDLKEMLSEIL